MVIVATTAWYGGRPNVFMGRKLSLKHSALSNKCEACHTPWRDVTSNGCIKCHAKMAKHVPPNADKEKTKSVKSPGCTECHREHGGTARNIKVVTNSSCTTCHKSQGQPRATGAKKPAETDGASSVGLYRHGSQAGEKAGGKPKLKETMLFPHGIHEEQRPFKNVPCDQCHRANPGGGFETTIQFMGECGWCHELEKHAADAKDKKGCPVCHTSPDYKVTWLSGKRQTNFTFSHARHSAGECTDCHKYVTKKEGDAPVDKEAETSPVVENYYPKCNGCHREKMVNADCVSCHSYHATRN